jgi:hypothetical protein
VTNLPVAIERFPICSLFCATIDGIGRMDPLMVVNDTGSTHEHQSLPAAETAMKLQVL